MMRDELGKIDNRVGHLRDHAERAKHGAKALDDLGQKATRMAKCAEDVEVSPSTRAWHHEGFTLNLWFNDAVPDEVLDLANAHFDNFALYGSNGHVDCKSKYDFFVRATVKVKYD